MLLSSTKPESLSEVERGRAKLLLERDARKQEKKEKRKDGVRAFGATGILSQVKGPLGTHAVTPTR